MTKISTPNCRDCGKKTWNKTERCNPCKKKWQQSFFDKDRITMGLCLCDTFKGDADTMAALKAKCKCEKCTGEEMGFTELNGEIIHTSQIGAELSCKECGQEAVTLIEGTCNTCLSKKDENDHIDWPKHYNHGKIQPIDVIEDWKLDFRLASALKYIGRYKHKENPKRDLEKAVWYIQRYIDKEL